MVTASKEASANGRRMASAAVKARSGRRRLPTRSMPEGEVGRHHVDARVGERLAAGARAGGDVEHALPGLGGHGLAHEPAPATVLPHREHVVGEVVPRRDVVEHRGHLAGALVQAGADHGLILADAPRTAGKGGRSGRRGRPVVGLLAVTSSPGPDPSPAGLPAPLVARTVAIDDPGPLLSLLPATDAPDMVSWVRGGSGLVGWGRALTFEARRRGPLRRRRAGGGATWWRTRSCATTSGCPAPARSPSGRSRSRPSRPPARRSSCPRWSSAGAAGGGGSPRSASARTCRPTVDAGAPGATAGAGPGGLRRRRALGRAVVRRRRGGGGAHQRGASSTRSSWLATSSWTRTRRSTRGGCCSGWPSATTTPGCSPSTASSARRPSCSCGSRRAWSPPASWPARSAVPATTRTTSPSPRRWRARPRTSRSTSTPCARSPTRWRRTARR